MEFERVPRAMSLADEVAARILRVILAGHLKPGDRLPSERELGAQFGVSRTVVREAIRSLAGRGIVNVVSGRGLAVARVDGDALREPMNLYLRGSPGVDYPKVHEIRRLLEVEVACLAAERATDGDLLSLEESCLVLLSAKGIEELSQADVEFHRRLSMATHNELFLVLLDAIADPLLAVRRSTFGRPGRIERTYSSHRAILDRLVAHDGAGARVAMRDHLDDVELAWEDVAMASSEVAELDGLESPSRPGAQERRS
ncbi:MAG: FadR/GntR family transcriptional regulator [Candidatus Limnocylindrales bacterium]|jgi:GntR family transcriptional repressor for pyruvate dehydrogenase complex